MMVELPQVTTSVETPLASVAGSEGAQLSTYSGAITATSFGSADQEFHELLTGCGVYDLGWRGKIIATGEDRIRWFNGMVTNNIRDLRPGYGNYNFVLNAQGRIQGDLYIYNRGEYLLLDTERSQVETLMKTLNHFIIMDDVELNDASGKITSIGIQGPNATEVLKAVGIEPSCADPLFACDLKWHEHGISVTRMVSDEHLTYEIWLSPAAAIELWRALRSAGAKPVGTAALEKFRVYAGVPKYGQDIRERDLPQETGQMHAISFTAGCYIGQEIVERIRSRGNVHRQLSGFVLENAVPVGSKMMSAGKEVGEITSVADIPVLDSSKKIAMGYIRREAGGPGTSVQIGETRAIVTELPFKF
jgi:folate-binding protein YgfZ